VGLGERQGCESEVQAETEAQAQRAQRAQRASALRAHAVVAQVQRGGFLSTGIGSCRYRMDASAGKDEHSGLATRRRQEEEKSETRSGDRFERLTSLVQRLAYRADLHSVGFLR
jgi:hypothetical protein